MKEVKNLVERYKSAPDMVNFVALRKAVQQLRRELQEVEMTSWSSYYEDQPEYWDLQSLAGSMVSLIAEADQL